MAAQKKRQLSEKAKRRIRQRNRNLAIAIIIIALAIFAITTVSMWRYVNRTDKDKISKNIYIGRTDVSGMTKEEAVQAVTDALGNYQTSQLILKVGDQSANVAISELNASVEDTDKLVKEALEYGKKGNLWTRFKQLKGLKKKKHVIDESFMINQESARQIIEERVVPLAKQAVNATASYNGSGFDLTDEEEGYTVAVKKSLKKIVDYMNKEWDYEDAEIEMVLKKEEPAIKKADLESLQDELGSYSTEAGYGDRVQNLQRAAELLNGSVIMPGEEFSVEQATLPYTEENGYVAGSAYENGQIVESIGGGLCQVSTTLYNAVLYAELEVTERSAHSMIVTYVDPSRDAAIAEGVKDFKFVNSYDTPILIEGYINSANQLEFHIYGKDTRDPGHSVEFESETLEKIDYTTRYVEDAESPIGSITKEGSAINGRTARLWRIIYENGEEVSRDVINNSTYKASEIQVKIGTASDNADASAVVRAAIDTQDIEQINAAVSTALSMGSGN